MKTVIDTLTATTGWTGTATVAADTWPMFAASYLPGQLRMDFTNGQIASKTYSPAVDVTGLPGLCFNAIAKTADAPGQYRLKVRFYSGVSFKEFWVPLTTDFLTIQFKNYYSSISKVEFEAVANVSIFISEIIAYRDQMPLDAEIGVKQVLDLAMATETLPAFGVITGAAGQTSVEVKSPNYVGRYACFTVGGESYQLFEGTQDNKYTLTPFGDAVQQAHGSKPALKTNKNATPATLLIPVEIEPRENEAALPGIAVYSDFDAEPVEEEEYYTPVVDSIQTDGNVRTSIIGRYYEHLIKVEADARAKSIREICLRVFKKAFSNKNIWVNGRRCEITFDKLINQPFDDATDFIGKLNVEIKVRVSEEIWPEEIQPPWTITQEVNQLLPP